MPNIKEENKNMEEEKQVEQYNEMLKMEQEFDEKLSGIIDMLDTCRGQYTDTEYKDVRIYDRIHLLMRKGSGGIKDDLIVAKRKIRETYLLLKDLLDDLRMYGDMP